MAFTGNYVANSFLKEALEGRHKFRTSGGHTFKLALYDNNASFTAVTTDYTTTNEISGTGYTAGGLALVIAEVTSSGNVGFADFNDAVFSTVTISGVRGGLIYNTTYDGGSSTTNVIHVLDFGRDFAKTAANFTVVFPTADALNAIIRLIGPDR